MLIKCSTPYAKIQIPKMIQWQDIKVPTEWFLEQESPIAKPIFDELDLTHIQQYLDGTVKISFQNNQPLRINEGIHSFAGSKNISKRDQDLHEFLKKNFSKSTNLTTESISKRDQDLNDFLEKNFEKPVDLKLKGISDDKLAMFTIPPNKKLPLHMASLLVKKKTMVILFVYPINIPLTKTMHAMMIPHGTLMIANYQMLMTN